MIRKFLEVKDNFYLDVVEGLSKKKKELPSKYFYDERGSELFEKICDLEEYYPTDCEVEIMDNNIGEISNLLGSGVQLIELGSGSSMKTRLLLDHVDSIVMYVPVDISKDFLEIVSEKLEDDYPNLNVWPLATDYTETLDIPDCKSASKRIIYFPGSTIGNFEKEKAKKFLQFLGSKLSKGDGLLIGVDLKKDREVLELAYNDKKNITAEFNKNILERVNRELGADFNLNNFEHYSYYNSEAGRIEMHLVSREDQQIRVNGSLFSFKKGESIHTENSHKYTIDEFEELTSHFFKRSRTWVDSRGYFSVHYFEKK